MSKPPDPRLAEFSDDLVTVIEPRPVLEPRPALASAPTLPDQLAPPQVLLQAFRQAPRAPLAFALVEVARQRGNALAVTELLEECWTRAPASEQPTLHRLLARLWRRQGRIEQARLHLYQLLAERPGDARAQAALAHLLAREARHRELEQALARASTLALARARPALAYRYTLARARVLAGPLGDRPAAGQAFNQAASYAERARRRAAAFDAHVLALHTFALAGVPAEVMEQQSEAVRAAAKLAQKPADADAALRQLLIPQGPEAARYLVERAVAAEGRGSRSEAAALWEAALEANPSAADAAERLAHLLATRKAWGELAAFHARQAERAPTPEARILALRRQAEVLEGPLRDLGGAALAHAAIFRTSGDPADLLAQLERMERAGGQAAADAALDRSVREAPDLARRATALRLRADRHFASRRFGAAAADLQRLSLLRPLAAEEQQLLAVARAEEGEPDAIRELWTLTEGLAPKSPGRADLFRRLARLSAWPLGDAERSRTAWTHVLAENPGDAEAEERLLQLARARGTPEERVPVLRARAERSRRGPEARQARHELAQLLEQLGRVDEALEAWREAVRAEPGDGLAQRALAERLESRGRYPEAALALEAAAQALDDPRAQGEAWARLALLAREKLDDAPRAARSAARAKALGAALPEPEPVTPSGPLPPVPPPPGRRPPRAPEPARPPTPPVLQPAEPRTDPASKPRTDPGRTRSDPGSRSGPRARRRTDPSRLPLNRAVPPKLLAELEKTPLDGALHLQLAEHCDRQGDVLRARLFTEVARALEGDPHAEPLAPKGTLSATERLALRHPELRGPHVEALSLVGEALVAARVRVRKGPPFTLDAGKGAPVAGQALLDVVRLLGQRAPDVVVSPEEGPPFALEPGEPVQVAVGKLTVRKGGSPGELRFFAARALYALAPELYALRLLETEALVAGMDELLRAIPDKPKKNFKPAGLLAKASPKARERLLELGPELKASSPLWDKLMLAARHSANRAGLVAAGGVAPALRALQAKQADQAELAELVRFAISDRMVRMRATRP